MPAPFVFIVLLYRWKEKNGYHLSLSLSVVFSYFFFFTLHRPISTLRYISERKTLRTVISETNIFLIDTGNHEAPFLTRWTPAVEKESLSKQTHPDTWVYIRDLWVVSEFCVIMVRMGYSLREEIIWWGGWSLKYTVLDILFRGVLTSNLDRNTRKYVIVSCILLFFSIVGLYFL